MNQQVQASNYLCLDILLAFIDHMAKRMDVGSTLIPSLERTERRFAVIQVLAIGTCVVSVK